MTQIPGLSRSSVHGHGSRSRAKYGRAEVHLIIHAISALVIAILWVVATSERRRANDSIAIAEKYIEKYFQAAAEPE